MTRSTAPTEPGEIGELDAAGRGAVPHAGELVGRYQVRRLIGEGGMGSVYLARDITLGRSVALKIVRPDRLGAADVNRFIAEARTVARFNHPHIVVLYDVGEHRGAPYLALEYLDGESLQLRALRERLSLDEVARLARAIADGLAHAHAAGVLHCDLKPSNVMLPNDGRIRVVDFGLALTEGSDAGPGRMAGTPDWMAPEQWRGEPLTDRVDAWALGVLVYELVAGVHPFGRCEGAAERSALVLDPTRIAPPLVREGLDPRIADLVARSLDRDPEGRPSCRDWCLVLDGVLAPSSPFESESSPYRGLAAFDERHAHAFFGRESDIGAFLERLRAAPVLPIVGPSGAGKSSFLNAGLIPRLRARERWTVIAVRPGADPFMALAHRLTLASGASGDGPLGAGDRDAVTALAAELRATPTLLALRLATIAAARESRVLLAIDQLEEIFTHDVPASDVQPFLQLVASASDDPAEPVRAVFTVRDDFLGRVPDLRQVFVLNKLEREPLRRAVVMPLERTAYRLEDEAMVEDILDEIGDAPGSLPLLQFVCSALWDSRDMERRLLLRDSYRRLGGVAGALARHADACMAELPEDQQRLARQLLTRLVAGTTTRRVVERAALLAGLDPAAERVLDRLLSARLVSQSRAYGEGGLLVELAHESLLQTWDQLSRWVNASREERRLLDELEGAASLWDRRGRRPEETWSADELVLARGRIRQLALVVPPDVETFLCEGERRHAAARRRSRLRVAAGALLAAVVTIGSIAAASEFRRQKLAAEVQAAALRLAAGNLGRSDLVLRPYDWVNGHARPAAPAELAGLAVRFHAPAPGDVHRPGPLIPPERAHTERLAADRLEVVERAEVAGGTVFLRIDGRGRAGEQCEPSWIRLQSMPGYSERATPRRIELAFPTCRASAAGMVEIPAGPFIYGGPGDPPTRFPDYVERERTETLDTYWIDRTETSNAAYRAFAVLEPHTGYPAPKYESEGPIADSRKPDVPVTSIDAFTAEAFCRFMGKSLPSDYEWTKAARGGLELGGKPNPHPRRLYPWGTRDDIRCANSEDAQDGFEWVAPADSFRCGASPYGVLNLVGNVAEWISREGTTDWDGVLRVIRGGAAIYPRSLEHLTTVFRNKREARFFAFSIGLRCVASGSALTAGSW